MNTGTLGPEGAMWRFQSTSLENLERLGFLLVRFYFLFAFFLLALKQIFPFLLLSPPPFPFPFVLAFLNTK